MSLAQRELVEKMYHYDNKAFSGINPTTISRWERGENLPSYKKIAEILAFFQDYFKTPLPFIESKDINEIENLMNKESISMLFKPKRMVAQIEFDNSLYLKESDFKIISLRNHKRADEIIELNSFLHSNYNTKYTQVDIKRFKEWIEYPNNLFIALTYKDTILGLLFMLQLKPESFRKIIDFEIKKSDLNKDDFITNNKDKRSIYLLSLFSLSTNIASRLFARMYAHLIYNQNIVEDIGLVTSFDEAIQLAKRMNLKESGSYRYIDTTIYSYRAKLYDLALSDIAIKSLFTRE
jgi:transcriptional regulator with XRE-family HTH domain